VKVVSISSDELDPAVLHEVAAGHRRED
jgi:hypothetical protein